MIETRTSTGLVREAARDRLRANIDEGQMIPRNNYRTKITELRFCAAAIGRLLTVISTLKIIIRIG